MTAIEQELLQLARTILHAYFEKRIRILCWPIWLLM